MVQGQELLRGQYAAVGAAARAVSGEKLSLALCVQASFQTPA